MINDDYQICSRRKCNFCEITNDTVMNKFSARPVLRKERERERRDINVRATMLIDDQPAVSHFQRHNSPPRVGDLINRIDNEYGE